MNDFNPEAAQKVVDEIVKGTRDLPCRIMSDVIDRVHLRQLEERLL